MSDLSQLLGDLYGDDETPTRAPSWSSEDVLDDAFASWVPGPGADAPAAERAMVSSVIDEPAVEVPTVDDWALDTAPAPAGAVRARWSPSDDDILPSRRGPRVRLQLRRSRG